MVDLPVSWSWTRERNPMRVRQCSRIKKAGRKKRRNDDPSNANSAADRSLSRRDLVGEARWDEAALVSD